MFIFIYGIIFTSSEVELWKNGPTTPLSMLNQRILPGISEDFLVIRLHIACDRHNLPYVPASDKMALACSFGRFYSLNIWLPPYFFHIIGTRIHILGRVLPDEIRMWCVEGGVVTCRVTHKVIKLVHRFTSTTVAPIFKIEISPRKVFWRKWGFSVFSAHYPWLNLSNLLLL